MRVLLDTCVALWWIADSPELTEDERLIISDADNEVYVSAASAWEVEIKRKLGKLDIDDDWKRSLESAGFAWLNVNANHTEWIRRLPDLHRDPFDRMLVAQAMCEGLTVMTHDDKVAAYFR